MSEEKNLTPPRTIDTIPFKLKDKNNRHYRVINLKNSFGYIPETIIVEKVLGKTNTIIVRALVTEAMYQMALKKQAAEEKEAVKEAVKKVADMDRKLSKKIKKKAS